ncbi:MAG: glycoside hydrolase family 88 protein [Defluviitaleaceae bacterium]|nr:glycoside hydrolase family 88 protein [Defluviitaleaceae bacterium]
MLHPYEPYFKTFLNHFTPYKGFWCYEDGVILKGAIDLYEVTNDEFYWHFLEAYLNEFVDEAGDLKGYTASEYNIDHLNAGKALFFAYEKTKDARYLKAIRKQMDQVHHHPRIPAGNFWHKKRYPHQVWLDGLYMALPFYAEYEHKYNGHVGYADIYNQFKTVEAILRDEKTGLYYHAYDDSKSMFWANQETGLSENFWLRAEGWLLMALVDTVDQMSETIFEYHKGLKDLAKRAITDILPFRDEATGMWWQVIDQGKRAGNYVEVSGTAMVAYAILKGIRLNILDDALKEVAIEALAGILTTHGYEEKGQLHIGGIVCVAGLGEFEGVRRDGSYAYYISEKVVADEAKAVGPLMSAYAEYLKGIN